MSGLPSVGGAPMSSFSAVTTQAIGEEDGGQGPIVKTPTLPTVTTQAMGEEDSGQGTITKPVTTNDQDSRSWLLSQSWSDFVNYAILNPHEIEMPKVETDKPNE